MRKKRVYHIQRRAKMADMLTLSNLLGYVAFAAYIHHLAAARLAGNVRGPLATNVPESFA